MRYHFYLLARRKMSQMVRLLKKSLSIFAEPTGDTNTKKMVDSISLSRNTVMRRVEEMADDVSKPSIQLLIPATFPLQ
jgi:hypothetical protein